MTQSLDISLDNSNSKLATDATAGGQSSKKSYATPVLTVYGSVAVLTQSGSQPLTESATPPTTKTRRKVSDIRMKENILCIGRHPLGFGLYLFDYKQEVQAECGHGRQFGVMAQEVEKVLPAAVLETATGYKMVDYGMLGIHHILH